MPFGCFSRLPLACESNKCEYFARTKSPTFYTRMSQYRKHILFTGATSGLGKVAAMELADRGALVVATYRQRERAEGLLQDFAQQFPQAKGRIELLECNLASLQSVQRAADTYLQRFGHLDLLVNNAGIWNKTLLDSPEGIEETLAVNVLAPLLLMLKLAPTMKKQADPRIINTASGLHQGYINLPDLELRADRFSGFIAYRQSKLALILLTRLLAKKLADTPVKVYSFHPGVVSTEIGRSNGFWGKMVFRLFGKSPAKGAETLLFLTQAMQTSVPSGEYFENKRRARTSDEAYNLQTAELLYQRLLQYFQQHLGQSYQL